MHRLQHSRHFRDTQRHAHAQHCRLQHARQLGLCTGTVYKACPMARMPVGLQCQGCPSHALTAAQEVIQWHFQMPEFAGCRGSRGSAETAFRKPAFCMQAGDCQHAVCRASMAVVTTAQQPTPPLPKLDEHIHHGLMKTMRRIDRDDMSLQEAPPVQAALPATCCFPA